MGQKEVYLALKELGGKATTKQVKELLKKRYPKATLWHYAYAVLQSLSNKGYISRIPPDIWKIQSELDF